MALSAARQESPLHTRSDGWIVLGLLAVFAALIVGGVVALRSPGATIRGNEMSLVRAVFTAVNAATLTGFQQTTSIDQYGPLGQATIFLLTLASTVIFLIVGGIAIVRVAQLPYTAGRVAGAVAVAIVLVVFGGGSAMVGNGRSALDAMFQAISAFGNSGLIMGRAADVSNAQTHLILMPLALLGGLGIAVLMEVYDWLFRQRRVSAHARAVGWSIAAIYLIGTLAVTAVEHFNEGQSWRLSLMTGSFAAIDSRTAGFPMSLSDLGRATQWIIFGLMAIGAASGGTGAGLKTTTLAHLARSAKQALSGQPVPRGLGIAICWVAIYVLIVALGLLTLLSTEPQMAADHLLFIVVSAVSNAGLSHDPVSLGQSGMWLLSAVMLAGRLIPIAVLWWAGSAPAKDEIGVG